MKLTNSLLLVCFLLISTVTPSHALFNNDVKKAKEFVQVGMVPQAVTLLEKRITEKPTDGEAHFLLGTLYIKQGELGRAEQRFKSAVIIDSSFGYKIGGEYKKEGMDALAQGQYGGAERLFHTAVQYQPDLGKEIAQEYFNVGKRLLNQGDRNSADRTFSIAVKFDSSFGAKVTAINKEWAKKNLKWEKANKPANQRNNYVRQASKYLSASPSFLVIKRHSFISCIFNILRPVPPYPKTLFSHDRA